VFALDQAGEWLLDTDIGTVLAALLPGRATARLRDVGSWSR
jgi:hypothetical protein